MTLSPAEDSALRHAVLQAQRLLDQRHRQARSRKHAVVALVITCAVLAVAAVTALLFTLATRSSP